MKNEAMFVAGCFWGVEHLMKEQGGVISTEVGYSGGHTDNPSYEDVCRGDTGHYEVVKVDFDSDEVSYEDLVKLFFEIHDFEQTNGQGPDIGHQYLSVIFYYDENQKQVAERVIEELEDKGYKVATKLLEADTFWPAEDYHQKYYDKKGSEPYCHLRKKIF